MHCSFSANTLRFIQQKCNVDARFRNLTADAIPETPLMNSFKRRHKIKNIDMFRDGVNSGESFIFPTTAKCEERKAKRTQNMMFSFASEETQFEDTQMDLENDEFYNFSQLSPLFGKLQDEHENANNTTLSQSFIQLQLTQTQKCDAQSNKDISSKVCSLSILETH